jgi:hypothetical protein
LIFATPRGLRSAKAGPSEHKIGLDPQKKCSPPRLKMGFSTKKRIKTTSLIEERGCFEGFVCQNHSIDHLWVAKWLPKWTDFRKLPNGNLEVAKAEWIGKVLAILAGNA